jgi:hypothetical protein
MIPQEGWENMKRIVVIVLCLAVLAAAGFAAQATIVLKVKVQTANIRAEADASGAVIKQVALGTLLEARQMIGDWYEISITNETGAKISAYISATVVDVLSAAGQTPPANAAAPTAAPVSAPTAAPVPQPSYAPAPQPSYAPAPSAGGFKLIAGIGLANMSFTDSSTTNASQYDQYKKARFGFALGFGFETGGTIGFELDLLYLQKGVRYQGSMAVTGGTDVFDFTAKLDEISVPILLKFHVLNMATGPDVYLAGGGEIAYVMSPKVVYTASGPDAGNTTQSGTQDEKDYIQPIDYGLVFGGGISLPLGGGAKFSVEGRYHLGLANTEKVPAGATDSGTSPKTNALLILAGFRF